jgi:hypothetical protein
VEDLSAYIDLKVRHLPCVMQVVVDLLQLAMDSTTRIIMGRFNTYIYDAPSQILFEEGPDVFRSKAL